MLRLNDTITGGLERPLLKWLCERLPRWVTSDMLTALGVVGASVSFAGYALSDRGTGFLWAACAGLVLNWYGDSLDGTLARRLKAERPKYGFFLDHMTDTFAMALIAIGIGLSAHTHLICAMAVLLAYFLMVILTMATSIATGVFQIGYGGLGPTEIRLFILACTIAAILFPTPAWDWRGVSVTLYDVILLAVSALLTLMCGAQTVRTARALAIQDPPRR